MDRVLLIMFPAFLSCLCHNLLRSETRHSSSAQFWYKAVPLLFKLFARWSEGQLIAHRLLAIARWGHRYPDQPEKPFLQICWGHKVLSWLGGLLMLAGSFTSVGDSGCWNGHKEHSDWLLGRSWLRRSLTGRSWWSNLKLNDLDSVERPFNLEKLKASDQLLLGSMVQ